MASKVDVDVVIIGAGLAGLAAGLQLKGSGMSFLLLEGSDDVGGRVRTDALDGFLLDRGFQVFLNSYPEAQRVLDYDDLALNAFFNGAFIRVKGDFQRIADPWRHPVAGVQSLFNSIGTLQDKLGIARLRQQLLYGAVDDFFDKPESSTQEYLLNQGFSKPFIHQFFRAFFSGAFLEKDLATSSRMFQFIFRMFSTGEATLPAYGMGSIPKQLASQLPEEAIRFHHRVARLEVTDETQAIFLESGDMLTCRQVIVATDGAQAKKLLPQLPEVEFNPVQTLYFSTDTSPVDIPILVLDGDGDSGITNVAVPSLLSSHYAPPGKHLVSVSVLPDRKENSEVEAENTEANVRKTLSQWFGPSVDHWQHLRTYTIPKALPRITYPEGSLTPQLPQIHPGVFVCGDYRDTPSINGALISGRQAAEAVMEASVTQVPSPLY